MLRSVLPLIATLVAVLALEARAQTQVASLSGAFPPAPEIGAFTAVTNTVERRYEDLAFALGKRGGRTYANEGVRALEASSASIRLDDGTVLDVGPNSEITLDSFIYDPERGEQRLSLRFLSGIVRFTTGSMEKQAYEINTPVGSLTIRGTEFTLLMEEALHLVLNDGAITLSLFDGEEQDLDARDPDRRFLSVVDGAFITVPDTDGALKEAMNALELTFDTPGVHSAVVGDYMTAFFNRVTLETCASGDLCLFALERHFDRLCQIGVLRAEARRSLARIVAHVEKREGGLNDPAGVSEILLESHAAIRAEVDAFPVSYGDARSCGSPAEGNEAVQVTRVTTQSGGSVKLRIDEVGADNLTPLQAVQSSSSSSGGGSTGSDDSSNQRRPGSTNDDYQTPGKFADPGTSLTSPGLITPIQPIQITPIIINPISPPIMIIGN
jgi:hypothetical protein